MYFHARAVPHLRPQLPNQQRPHLQNHHRSSPPRRAKIRTRRFSCCCSTSGFAVAGKTTQVKPPALALGASCLILFSQSMPTLAKIIFVSAFALSFTGRLSPPIALTLGILFGLSFPHPYINESRGIARALLQSSVVALGFGMNLHEVLKAGRSGFIYTALGISFALLVFPPIGSALHFSQSQFGLWAALAIHDTSSVVGAATKFGPQDLVIGTTVKLARALWIVPLALATG